MPGSFADPYDVQDPSTGDDILAAFGDVTRQDLMFLHGKPRCRLHLPSNQLVGSGGGLSAVVFGAGSELQDPYGMHDPVSSPERITIPAGFPTSDWKFGATVQWEPNAGGSRRHAEIQVNGSGIKIVDAEGPINGDGYSTYSFQTPWPYAVAGDYFTLFVNHNAGVDINVRADGYAGTIFWAEWVGMGDGS